MLCHVCNKSFETEASLARHQIFHNKRKGHRCKICYKLFISKKYLLQHKSVHMSTNMKNVTCSQNVHFHAKPVSIPLLKRSKKIATSVNPYEIQKQTIPNIWNCGICKSSYSSEHILSLHFAVFKKKKQHLCPYCHKGFNCAQKFHDHVKTHDSKRIVCYVCGDFIKPKCSLEKHLKDHAEVKLYSCDVCDKYFSRKHDLKRHRNIHLGLKSKEKSSCPMISRDEGKISDHTDNENIAKEGSKTVYSYNDDKIISSTKITSKKTKKAHVSEDAAATRRSKRKAKKIDFREYITDDVIDRSSAEKENTSSEKIEYDSNDKNIFPGFECEICHKTCSTLSNLRRHSQLHATKVQTCNICKKQFKTERSYKLHLKGHTTDKHSCPVCKKEIKYISNYYRHLKKHSGKRPFECNVCKRRFYRRDDLMVHKKSHDRKKAHVCDICDDDFSSINNLRRHKRIHDCKSNVTCPYCDTEKRFIGNKNLWNHFEKYHQERLTLQCSVCCTRFASMYRLNKHQQEHVESECIEENASDQVQPMDRVLPLENTLSENNLANSSTLTDLKKESELNVNSITNENPHEQHIHSKEKKKSQACSICSKSFRFRDSLIRHLDNSHKGVTKVCPICSEEIDTDLTTHMNAKHPCDHDFKCNICDKSFIRRADLDVHHRTHTGEKPFVCTTCNSSFSSSSNLRRHEQLHVHPSKDLVCHICGKFYNCKNYLQTHIKRVHEMEKNGQFPCDQCSKIFTNLPNLKRHQQIHSGKKPHICEVCGKSFRRTDDLKVHTRVHAATPLYKCHICDKGYTQPQNLDKHLLRHQDKQVLSCKLCGKSFKQAKAYRRHQNSHSSTDVYYHCSHCKKAFISNPRLQQHVKKKHPSEEVTPQTLTVGNAKVEEINKSQKKLVSANSQKADSNSHAAVMEVVLDIDHKQEHGISPKVEDGSIEQNEVIIYFSDVESCKTGDRFKCTACEEEFSESSAFIAHLLLHNTL